MSTNSCGVLAENGENTWVSPGALRGQFIDHCAPLVRDVVVRDVRVDRQLDGDVGHLLLDVPAEVGDRLADHADVEVEADALDVARLLAPEQVAGAADLEVLHGDGHAGAELGVLGDGGQPVVSRLGQRLLRRVEEVGIGPLPSSPDATTPSTSWRSPVASRTSCSEKSQLLST